MRAQDVAVEVDASLARDVGEFARGVKELVILVEAHAHGEAVDFDALAGGGHDEAVAVGKVLHRFGRDADFFAVGGGPGFFLGERAAVERDGGKSGGGHEGESEGERDF